MTAITTEKTGGMNDVLSVCRATMLLEPLAHDFNNLLMVAPVRRIVTVAETLAKAASMNSTIEKMVAERGVLVALRDEGRARGAGDVVVPKAFVPDFDRVAAREGGNV